MKGTKYEIFDDLTFESKVIKTKQGKVEYFLTDEESKDKPVVLCSHGGIGGVDQARLMLEWVNKDKYRLLCVSRPGYLLTPLGSGQSIEGQADLFATLLDSLAIEKIFMVSASAGGPPAYTFAMKYPKKLLGLIAIDSVSGFYDMPETVGTISAMLFTSNFGQKILKTIGRKRPEWFASEIFKSEAYYTKKQFKKHVNYVTIDDYAKKFIQGFMNSMNPYNPRKPGTDNDMELYSHLTHLKVEDITVPSLIIHGTHDADVKFYDGVYAYENIKNAQKYWIEEGSHLGFWLNEDSKNAQKFAQKFLDNINDIT
ncbi:MAG: alpha/beta hydrolase [FCB group bacterium]|nr:alpha/beta hydrolase [FCB group bacterium]